MAKLPVISGKNAVKACRVALIVRKQDFLAMLPVSNYRYYDGGCEPWIAGKMATETLLGAFPGH